MYRPCHEQDSGFLAAPDDAFRAGPHVPARMVPDRVFGAGPHVPARVFDAGRHASSARMISAADTPPHVAAAREVLLVCALPYALPYARASMVPRRREVPSWSRAACVKCGLYAPSPILDGVMPPPLPEQTMPCP